MVVMVTMTVMNNMILCEVIPFLAYSRVRYKYPPSSPFFLLPFPLHLRGISACALLKLRLPQEIHMGEVCRLSSVVRGVTTRRSFLGGKLMMMTMITVMMIG